MSDSRYEKGLAVRKQVLGAAPVERIVAASRGAPNEDFQRFLNEYAWGDIWSRPDLSLRDRSLVTLGMLTAQSRSVELKTHIRGALNNGITVDEIREVFLQGTVYCGFPAAMTGLRLTKEVVDEAAAAQPPSTPSAG